MSALGKMYGALAGKASGPVLGLRGERSALPWQQSATGAHEIGGAAVHSQAYGGGKNGVDYFYEVANIFAQAARGSDFHLADEEGNRQVLELPKGADPTIRRMTGDLRTLFTLPNPYMTWGELLELYVIDLLAVGNAFWLKQGAMADGSRPLALYRIPPQFAEVKPGKRELIRKYKFGMGDDAIEVDPQFVVHTRLPNPHSDNSMLGLGVVQAAPQVFDVELGLVEAQRNFFNNGTVLSGALESDRTIPEASRKKSLREFRSMQRGSGNWFNVAFLERGLRYRPIAANAQQADYRNLSLMSRERLYGLLRTPMILAGVATSDTIGMKMDEARRFWSEEVAQPFFSRLADAFTYGVAQGYGYRFAFDYGYKMPESDRVDLATKYAQLPGITVGEVRDKAGLPRFPEDLVNPMTDEPINDFVLNLPGPSTEGPNGTPDNLGTGRPADPANVQGIPAGGSAADRQASRPDEGDATTRARRGRAGTTSLQPVRRRGKTLLFTPEQLAYGQVLEAFDGYSGT